MTLETERLVLRRWKEADLEPFFKLNADPKVMEYFPKLLSREESAQMIGRMEAHFEERGFGLWATELKETQDCIGFIGMQVPRFETVFTPCVEIGWRLAFEQWGRGLAVEGAKRVLDQAFGTLQLKEVISMTSRVNLRSQRVMQKLGMEYVPEYDFEHPQIEVGSVIRPHVTYRIGSLS
ncbi:MAG: GNAT family N-acetyltransferase [Bdellovibrionota bacterium]